jgi:hypothetical protein
MWGFWNSRVINRERRRLHHQTLTLHEMLEEIDNDLTNSTKFKNIDVLIEQTFRHFFERVGYYEFRMHDDEALNIRANEDFQRAFCKRFLNMNIGYVVEGTFYLNLGAYLQAKMPVYSRIWGEMLDNLMSDQTSVSMNNQNTQSMGVNSMHSTGVSHLATHQEASTATHGTTDTETGQGSLDTPQNTLIDDFMDNPEFFSNVGKSKSHVVADNLSNTRNDTTSNSDNTNDSKGSNQNASATTGNSQSVGRTQGVIDVYDKWFKSGLDLYTPVFDGIKNEQIFLTIFN